MRRHRVDWRINLQRASGAPAIAVIVVCAISASGQDSGNGGKGLDAGGSYPRLPGAVATLPEEITRDAPFDVARFLVVPPRDRNAAPLYLDAFFEFAGEMSVCFPEGPERERRRQAAADRAKRQQVLDEQIYKDPKSVPAARIDEVIKLYDTGFRKLALAHRRDRCVFETGFGFAALMPHIQAARQVARVAALRVRRAVERNDYVAAIREIESVLRLTRDLRPRGPVISQLSASAITALASVSMVQNILSGPGLRPAHCDRLVRVLSAHAANANDGFAEGLRADFISTQLTLLAIVRDQPGLAKAMGLKPGASAFKAILSVLNKFGAPGSGAPGQPVFDTAELKKIDNQLARTTPSELARHNHEVARFYRALLELDRTPAAERIARIHALAAPAGEESLSRIVTGLVDLDATEAIARATSRARTTVHAAECLAAVRRWQLVHKGTPRDLAAAVVEAGLKEVPADPYDGKSMRLAVIDGEPVVYSVGKDGKDDGALKDSKQDDLPAGDLLFRLPPVEQGGPVRRAGDDHT